MIDRQLVTLLGFTQPSSVMPLVRCRRALSLTVTQALVPLKDRALPNLPVAAQVALARAPVRPCPEASAALVPAPSLKPYAATRPVGAALATVTVTLAAVVRCPAVSRARAAKL